MGSAFDRKVPEDHLCTDLVSDTHPVLRRKLSKAMGEGCEPKTESLFCRSLFCGYSRSKTAFFMLGLAETDRRFRFFTENVERFRFRCPVYLYEVGQKSRDPKPTGLSVKNRKPTDFSVENRKPTEPFSFSVLNPGDRGTIYVVVALLEQSLPDWWSFSTEDLIGGAFHLGDYLRGTMVIRTHHVHKNLHILVFFMKHIWS